MADTPNWEIDLIYGGSADGEDATSGFIYGTVNEGWYYDRNFQSYNSRLTLNAALYKGNQKAFQYTDGDIGVGMAETEYVVQIPRDFAHPRYIGNNGD